MNKELLKFIVRIERIAQEMEYGTMSCNVVVTKGTPNTNTFHIVTSKRKRFPPNKESLTEPERDDKS